MTHTKRFLFITFIFFITAGISAFSQEKQKQSEVKSADAEPVSVTLYKNPDCQCCSRWAAYLETNGFSVTQKPTDKLVAVKDQHNVPSNLRACHTALINGYVVEGHVPVETINKMLREQPDAKGIAVPGMPAGSPGMGINGSPFKIFLFGGQGDQTVYGVHG